MNKEDREYSAVSGRKRSVVSIAQILFVVIVAPILVGIFLGGYPCQWWGILCLKGDTGGDPPPPTLPANAIDISFLSSDTKEAWIEAVTADFNASQFKTSAGHPIVVRVTHGNSGGTQKAILDGVEQPTIWSPGDQSWAEGANQVWQGLHNQPLITEPCTPTVYAPIGFGMWRPMAEALGWPDEPISWETIVSLAADPQGWASYGHPEWGQFKFGHTYPDYSNSGLLIMTALAYDTLGQTNDLTVELVKSDPVVAAMRNVELHTYHYGRQSKNLSNLMVINGPSYLHAINITEAEVLRANKERAQEMVFPLVFIFPAKGTFWAEQPFCILNAQWVSDEQNEAARLYREFLLAPEQQAQAMDYNLRPVIASIPLSATFSLVNGTDPSVTIDKVIALSSPSAEVAEAVKDVFHQTKKKATIVVVLDTSGSMKGAKIKEAIESTADFVGRLERGDQIYVYSFNSTAALLHPSGQAAEVKEELGQNVLNLFAQGDTILYDAVCLAVEKADDLRVADLADGEQRLYGVVVLSDGQDTQSNLTMNDMFNCLPSGEDVEGIKVYTIAYGSDADQDVLLQISNKTNGRMFDGDPDTIEDIYVSISAEQ